MYQVVLTKKAKKDLDKINQKYRKRIQVTLLMLANDPYQGKKLIGKYHKYRSIRVWPYRILYIPQKKKLIVFVIRIGHRQGVYKNHS